MTTDQQRDARTAAWNAALTSGDPGRIAAARDASLDAIFTSILDDDPRTPAAGWRPPPPSQTWRGLSGPFDCTTCGKHVLYDSGGPMQTLDGSQKQCRDCVQQRVDAHWAAKPDGVYAVDVCGVDGTVLATSYVRKGRAPMSDRS
jgi:hypothetical protein